MTCRGTSARRESGSMVELKTIMAARKRGWTLTMIAAAAGVSHQAISLRLRHLPKNRIHRKDMRNPRTPRVCCWCRKITWQSKTNWNEKFCSRKCMGEHDRKISNEMILTAIELRRGGHSWNSIAKKLQFPVQSIQQRIWYYLHNQGLLNVSVLWGIWVTPSTYRDRSPSWNWLEKNTGLRPEAET